MLLPTRFARYCFTLFCLLTIASVSSADEADFPLPPSLEPAVDFWIRL